MNQNLAGQGKPHRLEHDGPIDGVKLQDVLADNVQIGRPSLEGRGAAGAEGFADDRIAVGEGDADIIDKCVEPNVSDEGGVERNGDAPVQAFGRPRDAEILQRLFFQEAEHLIAPVIRGDEAGIGFNVFDDPILMFAQLEVIVVLP